jgi:putative ABC transport system permease protein
MAFVFRMAWREIRATWARLLFFFVCVAIGVAAIIALRSIIQNVRDVMTRESRALIAADIRLETTNRMTDAQAAAVKRVLDGLPVLGQSTLVQTFTMARPAEGQGIATARLAEVRGVDDRYPLYGRMTLQSGREWSHDLVKNRGAVVQPDVLSQLGLAAGNTLVLAGQSFEIRDVLTHEQVQRRGGISFGPRIYVDLADLVALPVFGRGARTSQDVMLKFDAARVRAIEQQIDDTLDRQGVNVISSQRLGDRLGNSLSIGENYLSLVGFTIVVLGGIGVWSVTRVFVQQKLKTMAVLKCLGASSEKVLATYVLQIAALTLAGCALGTLISVGALAAIPASTLQALRLESVHVTWSAVAQGTAVGLLVSLLFAIVPLLEIRQVKPLLLMRADTAPTARHRDWRSMGAAALIGGAIALVAVWQAGSLQAGGIVTGGLAVVALALHFASRGLIRLVRPLTRSRRFAVRHAVVSLSRTGSQARVVLMAVGLGAFFVVGTRVIQANLLEGFLPSPGGSPDLVMIDVQTDQTDGVRGVIGKYATQPPKFVPLMRARVSAVAGARANFPTRRAVEQDGQGLVREFGLTYRMTLEENERVVAGDFWTSSLAEDAEPEVSIEQELAEENQIGLGDRVTFDLAGRPFTARVTSVRHVEWDNITAGGFIFVFRPGPIEKAPHTFIVFVNGAADDNARGLLQRDLAVAYPNVSAIDARAVLKNVEDVLANVSMAVTVVGAVTLASGMLILIGAVAMTKFQRLQDAAIYRTLGAGRSRLASMVIIEYGLLGTLAGLMGAIGAIGLSFAVSRYLLEVAWSPEVPTLAAGVAGTAALVAIVGLVSSVDVLFRKPLGTLRTE